MSKKLKILVIDPNLVHHHLYQKLAQDNSKYSFDFCSKLSEGMDFLEKKNYHLILAENFFTTNNSHDWISDIRKQGHHQPLLIITHYKNDKLTIDTLKYAVEDYHYKTQDTMDKLPHILDNAYKKSKKHKQKQSTMSRLGTLERITKNFRNLVDTVNRPAQALYNQPATQKQIRNIEKEVEKLKSTLKNFLFD
ncbi:hypothetical protein K1X76_02345 [bacterium]|nr:hypothetical protein [bacterium]